MKNRYISILMTPLLFLSSCCLTYDYINEDKYDVGYSNIEKRAYIGSIYADDDNCQIELPNEYNDIKIKDLGGYFGRGVPCPFSISLKSDFFDNEIESCADYGLFLSNYNKYDEIIDIHVYVTLPTYLEKIVYTSKEVYVANHDNKLIAYRPLVSFQIDDENKYFYTSEGKIYYKNNDKLVDGFVYE